MIFLSFTCINNLKQKVPGSIFHSCQPRSKTMRLRHLLSGEYSWWGESLCDWMRGGEQTDEQLDLKAWSVPDYSPITHRLFYASNQNHSIPVLQPLAGSITGQPDFCLLYVAKGLDVSFRECHDSTEKNLFQSGDPDNCRGLHVRLVVGR